MEELLDWVMENTNGSINVVKYRWGGLYYAFNISFEVTIYTRGMQIARTQRYCSLSNDIELGDACKLALQKLKSGYLNEMMGDVIDGKIGARFVDGNKFAELNFGEIKI